MSSANGPEGPGDGKSERTQPDRSRNVELQLFESLVHHLIEKGVLTRNDALSVVQTVAEVKRGQREAGGTQSVSAANELVVLERLYRSFELVSGQTITSQVFDGGNVLQLRPPIHGDHPKFPRDD